MTKSERRNSMYEANMSKRYEVKATKNLDQFVIADWNRAIKPQRVAGIKKSILNYGYIPNPIIVNEKKEVIDGQGRLIACKELNYPIYYMQIKGIGGQECIAMNCYQKQWTGRDYVDFYAALKNQNYIRLQKLLDTYKLREKIVMYCADSSVGQTSTNKVKEGKFILTSEGYNQAIKVLNFITPLHPLIAKAHGRITEFMYALILLYKNDIIEPNRMKEQLEKYDMSAVNITGLDSACDELERVYNKRKNKNNKVYFRDAFRQLRDYKSAPHKNDPVT